MADAEAKARAAGAREEPEELTGGDFQAAAQAVTVRAGGPPPAPARPAQLPPAPELLKSKTLFRPPLSRRIHPRPPRLTGSPPGCRPASVHGGRVGELWCPVVVQDTLKQVRAKTADAVGSLAESVAPGDPKADRPDDPEIRDLRAAAAEAAGDVQQAVAPKSPAEMAPVAEVRPGPGRQPWAGQLLHCAGLLCWRGP